MCLQGSPGLSEQTVFFNFSLVYANNYYYEVYGPPLENFLSFFLIFFLRISDECPVKKRMVYGSVKDALTRKLEGTKSIQANDKGDLEFDSVVTVFK